MSLRPVLIVLLALVCYGYTLPRWADWSQTSRLALVRALVEQGTVSIDDYVHSTGDYALVNGHAYSDKAPGPALLAAPVYALFRPLLATPVAERLLLRVAGSSAFAATTRQDGAGLDADRVALALSHYVLVLLVVALPAALSVAVFDRLLLRWVRPGPALFASLGLALASTFAVYSGNLYSHALVAALLIGAWAAIERAGDNSVQRKLWLLIAGLLLGWAAISEYPSALAGAILGLYALWHCGRPAALWLAAGAAPALGVLVVYDLFAFGTPLPVGYAHSALWQDQHDTGFLSLTYPHPDALWGLTLGRFRGLFFRAPWLLLALPGTVLCWRRHDTRATAVMLLASAGSVLLVYGSSRMWWGGFAAGPRYIVPALPFLAALAAFGADRLWHTRAARIGLIAVAVVSAGLVWSEALAGQQFPPDSIRDPWRVWTLQAWRVGDIARNAGMALGFSGAWSLAPLGVVVVMLLAALSAGPPRKRRPAQLEPVTARGSS